MAKVYCKNCKYSCLYSYCNYFNRFTGNKDILDQEKRIDRNPCGKCQNYKRKWWKFWARNNNGK